ncbi:NepR family anti-sigma factor [Erythrobacter sp. R86502]|uniref:NepR family anti-sigma factor n=1 Tax=Erythrobacter sp. R86502 TaxID=3093846 RepID=UPI0036D33565
MPSNQRPSDSHESAGSGGGANGRRAPEWADGLKQLYDSVVEEALPDNFKDLLDRLDAMDTTGSRSGGGGASLSSRNTAQ